MATILSNHAVPPIVANKISQLVLRTRLSRLLAGGVFALTAAALVVLFAIVIDWNIVLMETKNRVLLTNIALIVIGTIGLLCVGAAAFRRATLLDAARQIDDQVPALQERWMSINEFASAKESPQMLGSPEMIRRVAEEAAQLEHLVEPRRIRLSHELPIALGCLAGCVAVWFMTLVADPAQVSILVRRFISPQALISLTIIQADTGDLVKPRGSKIALEATVSGRLRANASIAIRQMDGTEKIHQLKPVAGNAAQYAFSLQDLQNSFQYRFRSGDGQTEWHRVTIADRPKLQSIDFRIVPPAYSRLPEFRQTGLPKSIKALQGSRLVVRLESDLPLKSMMFRGEDQIEREAQSLDSNAYLLQMDLTETWIFRPILTSREGLTNLQPPRCEILVYKDQAPVVQIVTPQDEVAVKADDSIVVDFNAKDDLGISRAELIVYDSAKPDAEELQTIPIDLGDKAGSKTIHGQTKLDLKQFDLKNGREITYAIRVFDTKQATATNIPTPSAASPADQVAKADQSPNDATNQPGADEKENGEANSTPSENDKQSDNSQTSQQSAPASSSQPEVSQEAKNAAANEAGSKSNPAAKINNSKEPQPEQVGGGNTLPHKPLKPGKTQESKPGDEIKGARRPDFKMAMRELDTESQSANSVRRRLTIDEWAGSFESQVLEKLQIQIDPVLNELKETLVGARRILQPVSDKLKKNPNWDAADGKTVRAGDERLNSAEKIVVALVDKTQSTPYAFIGLQLQDIVQLHIQPARQHLADVTLFDGQTKPADLVASLVHIRRAIELLDQLTRQYETVKLNQKLAETMTRINKMHQLFIEGTFAMLASQKPNLNPKQREMMEFELTEEYLEKLKELLKKRLEIQGELAKLLSNDPRLLQRYMARTRLQADTLRDQLTLLNLRQQELLNEVQEGLPAADDKDGKFERKLREQHRIRDTALIAEQAAKILENFVVWAPLDLDVNAGKMGDFKEKAVQLAGMANDLAREAQDKDVKPALSTGEKLYQSLQDFVDGLPELLEGNDHLKLPTYVANRIEETKKLITDLSGWIEKERALESGEHYRAVAIDQHRIAVDTAALTDKLVNFEAQCKGISLELGDLAKQFMATMDNDLIPELEDAQTNLIDNKLPAAVKNQTKCVEVFTRAEKELDEVMEAMIKHLDSLPYDKNPTFPDDLPPETLDQLLAMLEDEARAAESLGIPNRPSNLIVERDWLKPGSDPGSGSGRSMQPQAAMKQSQQAQQNAGRIRRQTEGLTNKLTQTGSQDRQGTSGKPPERQWDTLGSKLEDHLRQGRSSIAPEKYRRAIEQYFETLAGKRPSESSGK